MKTAKAIRIAPFKLAVAANGEHFKMTFRGTPAGAAPGQRQDVELEFPAWWASELRAKLASIKP